MGRIRRFWMLLLNCLLCGVGTTLILVAAGSELETWILDDQLEVRDWIIDDGTPGSRDRIVHRNGAFIEIWEKVYPGSFSYDTGVAFELVGKPPPVPDWFVTDLPRPNDRTWFMGVDTVARGWPCRAFCFISWIGDYCPPELPISKSTMKDAWGIVDGLVVREWRDRNAGTMRQWIIPLRPIWPGLLLNIAFWTTIFAVPTFVITEGRRARLRRQGLCLKCRYDLRASTNGRCPECGTQNTAVAAPKSDVAERPA